MKEADTPDPPQEERVDPPTLAETCMRELVGRASFGHIRSVLRPVLRYVVMRQDMFPVLIQQRKSLLVKMLDITDTVITSVFCVNHNFSTKQERSASSTACSCSESVISVWRTCHFAA